MTLPLRSRTQEPRILYIVMVFYALRHDPSLEHNPKSSQEQFAKNFSVSRREGMEVSVTRCPPPAPRGPRAWAGDGGRGVAGGTRHPGGGRIMAQIMGPGAHRGRSSAAYPAAGPHTILYSLPFPVCVQEGGRLGLARWAGPIRPCSPLLPPPKPPKGGRRCASVPSRSCCRFRPPGI